MITRRGLITGLAGVIAARAIVRASSLMQVKGLAADSWPEPLPDAGWTGRSPFSREFLDRYIVNPIWQPIPGTFAVEDELEPLLAGFGAARMT